MEQDISKNQPLSKQLCVIDKITVPAKSIAIYRKKSKYIRNILREQVGYVKYEIFHQKGDNGALLVITVATWKDRHHLEDAKLVIQETMNKAGLNMPAFLEQHQITMERGIYHSVEE